MTINILNTQVNLTKILIFLDVFIIFLICLCQRHYTSLSKNRDQIFCIIYY